MDTAFAWALAVPGIIFLVVVAPLWVIFHYVTAWKRIRAGTAGPGRVAVDSAELERMRELCGELENRIESLETILDEEAPQWRER
ncbi:MAG: envelope stress response membrane protein PspB [Thiotrichales bacterium]|nr:envelope stress response membrane protein PspB [Thiotrichales bacterium]MCY4283909.1 envelope stress response membrane protein PspB [Thiotrichales bacterium]MCY4350158.1 envelope stress response membrane protein PspB [Thiotrichales bacterium]